MSAHTPGKWTVEARGTGVTSRTVEETNARDWPFAIYVPSPPFALGAVGALVSSHDGAQQRARLIAAAPQLYEALLQILDIAAYAEHRGIEKIATAAVDAVKGGAL